MLKSRFSARQQFERLTAKWEPQIRAAFLQAIRTITADVVIRQVIERIEKQDVGGAVEAMHLNPVAYRALERALSDTFEDGGNAAIDGLPSLQDPAGNRLVVRFDLRHVEAELWLRQHSSNLVVEIIDDQRAAIREALQAGMGRGDNPTRTALDVVGRMNPNTGRREGGIIGLTSQQSSWVTNARNELLSGDPAKMGRYFDRERRDRRFDKIVATAIAEERAVTRAEVDRITQRYSDRLLKMRGDTIGRTETISALNKSQLSAYIQAAEETGADVADWIKIWHSAADSRVRHTHRRLNGQKVGFWDKFKSPSGALLDYPGDPQAPAAERIACRCRLQVKIDFLAGVE